MVIRVVLLENLNVRLDLGLAPTLARSAKEKLGDEPIAPKRVSIDHDRAASNVGNSLESCNVASNISHHVSCAQRFIV